LIIRTNAKGTALLTALTRAFAELERLAAPQKTIMFTESQRTQDDLLSLLADPRYGEGIVLFNGTNSEARVLPVCTLRPDLLATYPRRESVGLSHQFAFFDAAAS
jgi:hypothetical protein